MLNVDIKISSKALAKRLKEVLPCLRKGWHRLKQEYHLNNNSYFQWLQLINSILEKWKLTINQISSDAKNLIIHGQHLIKGSRILILENLASEEIYQIQISSGTNKVTSVTFLKQSLMQII